MDIRLSGSQYQEFMNALLDAYRDPFTLQRMLKLRLEKNLWEISLGPSLDALVFAIIDKAQAEGWTALLLSAAHADRPGNDKLRMVAARFGLSAVEESKSTLERLVQKSSQFIDVATFLGRGSEIEAQVCKVEVPVASGQMVKGTGFLVGPDAVLTNYHVMEPVILGSQGKTTKDGLSAKASDVVLRFDFKRSKDGSEINPGLVYKLAAKEWLIDSCPSSPVDELSNPGDQVPGEDELDYALLRVNSAVGRHRVGQQSEPAPDDHDALCRGWISLPEALPDISSDRTILIMQHPAGASLKLAIGSDAVVGLNHNGTRLSYQTSTLSGSSGSPVFNVNWQLVALHNSGDPNFKRTAEFNRGIPANKIYASLAKHNKLAAINGGE